MAFNWTYRPQMLILFKKYWFVSFLVFAFIHLVHFKCNKCEIYNYKFMKRTLNIFFQKKLAPLRALILWTWALNFSQGLNFDLKDCTMRTDLYHSTYLQAYTLIHDLNLDGPIPHQHFKNSLARKKKLNFHKWSPPNFVDFTYNFSSHYKNVAIGILNKDIS